VCGPFSVNSTLKVNTVVSEIYPVLQNVELLLSSQLTLSDDLHGVLQKVILLDKDYSRWPLKQPDAWRPKRLESKTGPSLSCPSWWPGKVDIYFDCKDYSFST
jgi:hypothetical protein